MMQGENVAVRVTVRRFNRNDIPDKVRWINDPANNRFLHYDLPLTIDKTEQWYERVSNDASRYDAVIEADGVPCGLIGLLDIDSKNKKAEFYVTLGEAEYRGRGVALTATAKLLDYAFGELGLHRIYLYTETENTDAQKLFGRAGFIKEGCLRNDLLVNGIYKDRFIYGLCKDDYDKRHR